MTAKQQMMWLWRDNNLTYAEIGRRAGLATSTVRDVCTGRTTVGTPRVREAIDRVYREVKGVAV